MTDLHTTCLEIHITANTFRLAAHAGQLASEAAAELSEHLAALRAVVATELRSLSDTELLRYAEEIAVQIAK
jgi:hypothetical protein